jgi:peptide/nickel transport system substrate-binding protein
MDELNASPTSGALTRRTFVKRAALLGLTLPIAGSLLTACGGDDDDDDPTPTESGEDASPATTATQQISVQVPTPTRPAASGATAEASEAASPEATTAATAPAAAGTRGGSAVFLREGDANNGTYDPVLSDDNDVIWVIFSVYETLVKANPQGTGIDPGLAESYEITEDALTATFNLRPGVKFSDGTDLTTEDVIFSLERARDSETSPWNFTLAQAQEITAPDDATIVINLSEPYAPFFAAIAMFNSGIISKAFFEANATESDADVFGGLAITTGSSGGTGPYAITEWKITEQTVLTRNEYYWDEGKPYLDEIILRTVPDSNSMILQLQGGDVDGVIGQTAIPFNRVSELQGDDNLQVIISPAAYNYFARVNTHYQGIDQPLAPRPPFDDLNFRKAMAHAIDYQTLIDTVQFGIAEPSNSILPRGAMFWNPDQVSPEFDLDKAREFLAQSSSPEGGQGEVLIVTGNAQQEAIATALQAMWAEINFELLITPLDTAVATQRTNDGDYDVRLGGWTNDMIDPDQILSYFVAPEASSNARTGYLDEEAAALVAEGRSETDDDKRREIYYEIQERWLDGPLFYLFNIPYVAAVSQRIKGYHQNPLGPWYFVDMYIEE